LYSGRVSSRNAERSKFCSHQARSGIGLLEELGRYLNQYLAFPQRYIAVINLLALDHHCAALGGVDGGTRPVEAASGDDLHAALLTSRVPA
jgi:hypothetical protein